MLGHKVSKNGIEVDKAKIEVIDKLPPPTSAKVLEVFWVMLDFTGDSLRIFPK